MMTDPLSLKPVMVVDDDDTIRDTITMILEFGGFQVKAVANGAECLEEMKKGFKGLVLLDIMMPGMDGWAVVKAMNETGLAEGNRVCMVSALEPDPNRAFLSPLVRGYIRKPFDSQDFLNAVKELLSSF